MILSFPFAIVVALFLAANVVIAENIDPYNDDSQYAYGENAGWFNAEPGGEGDEGVEVDDFELTGYVWGENIGWVNLHPTTFGGVNNDGGGNLSGYAWAENVGWINFNPTNGGVTIDTNGYFDGWAWGENIGWIHFKSEFPVDYQVQTSWTLPSPTTTTTTTTGETTSTTVSTLSTTTTTAICICRKIYDEDAEEIALLRYIRDNVLTKTLAGQGIIKLYYQWSPVIVQAMEEDEDFKGDVEKMLDEMLMLIEEGTE